MSATLDYRKESPQGIAALLQLERYVKDCGLEPALARTPPEPAPSGRHSDASGEPRQRTR